MNYHSALNLATSFLNGLLDELDQGDDEPPPVSNTEQEFSAIIILMVMGLTWLAVTLERPGRDGGHLSCHLAQEVGVRAPVVCMPHPLFN